MYIISLTFKVPLENIDEYLDAHVDYLNQHYETGNFLLSGRKVPRTGGVILAQANSIKEMEHVISKDPFKIHDLADFEITEIEPTKTSQALRFLMA